MSNHACDNHPDRRISRHFVNYDTKVVRNFCVECEMAYRATLTTPYKGKREAWETDLNMERDSQRARYGTSDWDDNINHDIAHRRAR